MVAHIACRPWSYADDQPASCSVVCQEHGLRRSFGRAHAVARAACVEHNAIHHAERPRSTAQLLSIVYVSSTSAAWSDAQLQDLLSTARQNNRAFGITGMLLKEEGWFLQALEGPAPIVDGLMEAIRRDPRHGHVHVLSREVRQQRRFPDWAMAHGHIGEVEAQPLAQYFEALLLLRGELPD